MAETHSIEASGDEVDDGRGELKKQSNFGRHGLLAPYLAL
jgi:hypothetical protein